MPPYERFRVWQESHQLVVSIYRTTESWPSRELYGLTSQARRAAFSIAANIAEGSAKKGAREFRRFLDTALGSTAELCYVLLLARDLGFISESVWQTLETQRDHAGKQLWGLYDSVRRRVQTQNGR